MFHLDALRKEGLIGHLGLTNTDTAHLRLVVESGIPIVSNQICYSLLDQRAAGEMATYCTRKGVAILAFGTLAGGFLTDKWLVRCAFFDRNSHSRMPVVPTPARLKLLQACDQWHSSQVSTFLTGSHCKLRPNTEGEK
jgi:aryl-alcohol dehydrogenase-like predicted oxidoreductase